MATKTSALPKIRLPILDYREKLVQAVLENDCVVVTGETGCGKTTQLPQYLFEAGLSEDGIIGVTQPRRVAAISVAQRVAEERQSKLGSTVGYKVRFDEYCSPETKIKYMTDGCLLREFLDDRALSTYSILILDEAHERSLATDILFGLMKHLLQKQATQMEATQKEATQNEATQKEATQKEATQKEATQMEATQKEATQMEATQMEATQREATQKEATQKEATQKEATQKEATQMEATQKEATQMEATQKEATQKEATQKEATQKEATQKEATQKEATQMEATQKEATQKEATQKEATQMEVGERGQKERKKKRLKVVVMSATLDERKFSNFFGGCPIFEIPGRVFPVDVLYCMKNEDFDNTKLTYMSHVCRVAMEIHMEEDLGDILIFLTGKQEIESVCDRLFKMSEKIDYRYDVQCKELLGMMVLPLYGSMSTEQQRKVFEPCDSSIRRVIVATNIAATSVTVNGVVYVIDSGFVKQMTYNARTGLDCLEVVPIAQSEAIQRTGRAGRTVAGKCYRLYSEDFYLTMIEATVPEIQRTSLTSVMLTLKGLGIANVIEFDYLDPPGRSMILDALKQLHSFQCIDGGGVVTELGDLVLEYPLQPSLARVMIRSKELGCIELVTPIVAMLSVEDVFIRPSGKQQAEQAMKVHKELIEEVGGSSDFAGLLAVYQQCVEAPSPAKWCKEHYIHWRTLKTARSITQQLLTIVDRQSIKRDKAVDKGISLSERVRLSLCYGLFGNVARKNPARRSFQTMDGHCIVAHLHPSSVLFGKEDHLDWVVYYQIVDTARTYMHTVCPVKYAWIKDLLPLLQSVDPYKLSQCSRPAPSPVDRPEEPSPKRRKSSQGRDTSQSDAAEERIAKLQSARERYLARKGKT